MSPDAAPPDDLAALADRLYLTVVHLLRRVRRADEALDLSAAQLSAIHRLVASGPMTIGELASAEGVRPPTMTRLVQRLEAGGYVLRRPDPDDGRASRITHTSRAMGALEAGRAARVSAFGAQLATLPAGQVKKLVAGLDVLEKLSGDPDSS